MSISSGALLVTGANGFVGRALLRRLEPERVEIRAAVRRKDHSLPSRVKQLIVPDVTDRSAWRVALADVDSVVHLAAHAHVVRQAVTPAQIAEYQRINVDGTRVLLEESTAAGVVRFVFVSSVLAVAQESDALLNESSTPRPVNAYGESKLAAELLVRATAAESGMRATILRPPLVYGPGMRANMLRLFALANRGLPLPFAAVRNRRSILFVDNLAESIWQVLQSEAASGETFFVSDGRDYSTPELIALIAKALGRPSRMLHVPVGALHAGAAAVDPIARLVGTRQPSEVLHRLTDSLAVDASHILRCLGFRPPFSSEEGLRLTAQWFQSVRPAG